MGHAFASAVSPSEWVFPLVPASYDASHKRLVYFPSESERKIPAMLLLPADSDVELWRWGALVTSCVIYFHPNAVDIGNCTEDMETIRDGAYAGDALMLAPEYPGYGLLMEYEPSVDGINLVAREAWHYCQDVLGFRPEQIMLWGRSIGAGPAADLAHHVVSDLADESVGQGSAAPLTLGGLVLIAPFSSITAVIMHHTASQFIASLFGPMWNVHSTLQDEAMKDVPLCIIHPKEDELIPSEHGLRAYQTSASRKKYGVWLTNATHNFHIQEDHLVNVGVFITQVIKSNRVVQMRVGHLGRSYGASAPAVKEGDLERQELVRSLVEGAGAEFPARAAPPSVPVGRGQSREPTAQEEASTSKEVPKSTEAPNSEAPNSEEGPKSGEVREAPPSKPSGDGVFLM
mmetsp:Transcript_49348/g.107457  ORF Transcript_49348/g.107457 Transcript_49348/m.107457 type:complete len:402 (-) Transcript_49348:24-1229(-)